MKREIIRIDEDKCNGCGLCVPNCHEGALQIINGKVRLISELMCDGLGACIGYCPEGAITIETRDAEPFDEIKVMEYKSPAGDYQTSAHEPGGKGGGCPGSRTIVINNPDLSKYQSVTNDQPSELRQWPVQMHLVNPNAPYFKNSDLLLAADCIAFSMGNFHNRYLRGKSLAIACPKLDSGTDIYIDKLITMIDSAMLNTITIMMMEVPCCGGLLQMVKAAIGKASRKVPVKQMIISLSGNVLKEEWA
jgi:NAD-dependent dihydropyrimidine dehydrogenase PreA subunit